MWTVGTLLGTGLFVVAVMSVPPYQTTAETPQTFRSPDGTSQFTYPGSYELYTDNGGVCFGPFESAKACAVFPQSRYAGTNFVAASFEEQEIDRQARVDRGVLSWMKVTTERACLTPPMRGENVPEYAAPKKDPWRIINGVRFLYLGTSVSVGMGTVVTTDAYRAFHKGRCYELSINLATTSFANSDPGTLKEFTREDEQHVRSELTTILDSFRFVLSRH
jgi:hypothetical protein